MSSKYSLLQDEQPNLGVYQQGPVHTQQPPGFAQTHTVIVTQPTNGRRAWTTGLCACCSDCHVCLCSYFCGLCLSCALAKKLEEDGCVGACGAAGLAAMRTKYRMKHGIEGSMMDDVCQSIWCGACAQCQLARDMKAESYPNTCCGMC